jgi:hypothetical protein
MDTKSVLYEFLIKHPIISSLLIISLIHLVFSRKRILKNYIQFIKQLTNDQRT